MKILLVEDNPLTAKGLQYLLEREGYQVELATSLVEAQASLPAAHYDLVLLDITLPDGDGFELAETIRHQQRTTPVIFLTARDDEADVVHGLELGADDYITKPFRNRELLLRIRKALQPRLAATARTKIGRVELQRDSNEVWLDGQSLSLSALEQRLLVCLLENAGQIVPRERLLDEIYDASGKTVNDNTLSVYLKRLREKLPVDSLITTVKNVGYRLEVESK